jgi:vacuolar-type H+-ATPase subunit E/Vma4
MELTLTSAERELLLEILEEHQRELLREIAKAKHHEFKSVLKNKEKTLESIVTKVEVAQPGEVMLRSA